MSQITFTRISKVIHSFIKKFSAITANPLYFSNLTKVLIVFLALHTFSDLSAQNKVERETRIKKRNVPEEAIEFVDDVFEGFFKVKWYKEISGEGEFFEAKFKWKSGQYSVKFDESGENIDIEKIITLEEIPENTRITIDQYFKENFLKYKILKVQKQLLGNEDQLEDYIEEEERKNIIINYEIEFHGVTETKNKLWEVLFDQKGNVILLREIILPPNFNLDF
ncbi:MAG: hypothetical protein ABR597_13050 [Bacteroidales bacterium]